MSVKSWNTFCKKINKERIEVEIMSPWKPEGWGCGLGTQRCQTHLIELGEGSFRMKEVGSGPVETEMTLPRQVGDSRASQQARGVWQQVKKGLPNLWIPA